MPLCACKPWVRPHARAPRRLGTRPPRISHGAFMRPTSWRQCPLAPPILKLCSAGAARTQTGRETPRSRTPRSARCALHAHLRAQTAGPARKYTPACSCAPARGASAHLLLCGAHVRQHRRGERAGPARTQRPRGMPCVVPGLRSGARWGPRTGAAGPAAILCVRQLGSQALLFAPQRVRISNQGTVCNRHPRSEAGQHELRPDLRGLVGMILGLANP